MTGVANDGWTKETEATATCFCGAVQLAFVSHPPLFPPSLLVIFSRHGDIKQLGKYGEVLIATLIACGSRYSLHPEIIRMKTPRQPVMVGDMGAYARKRKDAVRFLEERAKRLFHDSGILNQEPDLETLAVLLELVLLLQGTYL